MNRKNILKIFSLVLCISFVITGVSLFEIIPGNKNHEEIAEPLRDSEFSECIIKGVGTYFEITNSTYLNITVTSSEPIFIRLEVIPRMVSFVIKPNNTATSTVLTFTGFESNFEYYLYQDGNMMEEFTTDSTGCYLYQQDISEDHHVYIQEEKSTIYINADGSLTSTFGDKLELRKISRTGDSSRYVYTFLDSIGTNIVVGRDNIVLDGNGYKLKSGSGYGIYLNKRKGVLIKNLRISKFDRGIYLFDSAGNEILNNLLFNNDDAIALLNSWNNIIIDNTAEENIRGFILDDSDHNTLTGNTAQVNGDGFILESSSGNTLTDNSAYDNGNGFRLDSSSSNTLTDNRADYNIDAGFYLYDSSSNILSGNTAIFNYNGDGFYLESSSSNTLTGNTATDNEDGFQLSHSSSNTLTDNSAYDNGNGFRLDSSSSNTLTGNRAEFNDNGFHLLYSSSNTLTGNTANYNRYGFRLDSSSSNDLLGNTANYNSYYGFRLKTSSSYNDLRYNTATSNDRGFYISSSSSNTLTGNTANNSYYGFRLDSSSSNTLTRNKANDNSHYGFYLSSSSSNTLAENTATSNYWGFYLESSSSFNVLRFNTATSNNRGFYLDPSSSFNVLRYNTATKNKEYGFHLLYSSSNTLTGNTANYNRYGFCLNSSSGNTFTGNTANFNDHDGFWLTLSNTNYLVDNSASFNLDSGYYLSDSGNNLLEDNTATSNHFGFHLRFSSINNLANNSALYNLVGFCLSENSYGNLIVHNNFLDNLNQAYNSNPSSNYWYSPYLLEGNYWSDYTGLDDGSGTGKHAIAGDGIGDTDISWPSDGYDFYPLIKEKEPPFTRLCLFGDLGNDGWYTSDVLVVLEAISSVETSTIYSFDNETWYVYLDAFFIREEGITELYYRSIGGCTIEEIRSTSIKIDKTAPESEIILDGYLVNNEYYVTDVEVTLSAVDATSGLHHIEYYYGESDWMTYTEPFTITEHGITTIYYRAVDVAGNVEDINSEIVTIDKANCLLWFNEVITEKLVLEDLCIRVFGDLEIAETGELHLINCTIRINNGTNPIEYGINVYGGMYVSEGTKFTAFDPYNPYYFIAHEGSAFQMNDSKVEFCGHDSVGQHWLRGFTLWTDNCWVENNTFTNGTYGLLIFLSENSTIINNVAENNTHSGIYINTSEKTLVKGNLIQHNAQFGLRIRAGWFNEYRENTLVDNYYGVYYQGGDNSTFSNNMMINNTYMAIKIDGARNCTFSTNLASDIAGVAIASFYAVYTLECVFINNTVFYPQGSGFVCWYGSNNNKFINNTAQHGNYGFSVHQSSGTYLSGNIAIGGSVGFTLFHSPDTYLINNCALNTSSNGFQAGIASHNSTLIKNKAINCLSGISINEVDGVKVINNTVLNVEHTNGYGILIYHTSHIDLYGNRVENCNTGYYIYNVHNVTIENNYALGNSLYGIRIGDCSGNAITNNIVDGSTYGFYLWRSENHTITMNNITNNEYGLYIDNPIGDSFDHLIYHNNFINNVVQAYDDIPASSYWYNPDTNEGNYWSDYNGVDDGSGTGIAGDGIGDTDLPWYYDPYPFISENGWI